MLINVWQLNMLPLWSQSNGWNLYLFYIVISDYLDRKTDCLNAICHIRPAFVFWLREHFILQWFYFFFGGGLIGTSDKRCRSWRCSVIYLWSKYHWACVEWLQLWMCPVDPFACWCCFLPRNALLSAVYAVVVCLCVCLCVRHTPVLYQNG